MTAYNGSPARHTLATLQSFRRQLTSLYVEGFVSRAAYLWGVAEIEAQIGTLSAR